MSGVGGGAGSWIGSGGGGGGITVGQPVTGGGANRILYENAAGQIATTANATFDGTTLAVGGAGGGGLVGNTLSTGGVTIDNNGGYNGGPYSSLTVGQDISVYQNSFLTVSGVPYAPAYFLSTGAGYIDGGFNAIDGNGTVSAELGTGRFLIDGSGTASINWNQRQLYDSSGSFFSVDYNARTLNDSVIDYSIDWQNRLLHDGVYVSADWYNRCLYNNSGGTYFMLDWSGSISNGVRFDNGNAFFDGNGYLACQRIDCTGGPSYFDSSSITTNGAGKFSVYNGVTTAGSGVVYIPGNYSNIALTTSLGTTILYTHPSGSYGQYRITTNVVCHSAGTGTVSVQGQYTDSSNTAQTLNLIASTNVSLTTKGNNSSLVSSITAYPNSQIKFTTTASGIASSSASYDLFIILERIQ